jgi:hypothetical protein
VQVLAGKLTDAQAQQALDPVLQAMRRTTNLDALGALAQAVQALPGKLTDAQAQQALGQFLQAMLQIRTTDPDALGALARAVQALPGKLTDAQAQQALDQVLQADAANQNDRSGRAWRSGSGGAGAPRQAD